MTGFDHWCKEELKCRYYYRYADDIVILGESKAHLRNVLVAIKLYLKHVLKLGVKGNYQIFPVESRGIDFVGYVFRHDYIRVRKGIRYRGVIPVSATPTDVYVAINSQYHDYVELFKSWFGDNVDQKIIESAIIFWFKDVDCKAENKVVEYLGEY